MPAMFRHGSYSRLAPVWGLAVSHFTTGTGGCNLGASDPPRPGPERVGCILCRPFTAVCCNVAPVVARP